MICFADYLKQIVNWCFCGQRTTLQREEDKSVVQPCGKTAREILQIVGTDWFRSLDRDCWVRAYERGVVAETHCGDCLVLTPDVRFPNEVKCIQDLGGHVIRFLRTPFPDDKHESETALDEMEQMGLLGAFYNNDKIADTRVGIQTLHFDAIIDNREMSLEGKNLAVWMLINERGWL